jgi:Domain of unknown function (DUF4398)
MALFISRRHLRIAFAFFACSALMACAGAPVQEMSNARQAIRAAHEAGAEQVAPEQLTQARGYMEQAEASLQTRRYRDARRHAVAARGKAVEALNASQTAAIRPESG